jgi:phosphonoacetaldehyde hydrolase
LSNGKPQALPNFASACGLPLNNLIPSFTESRKTMITRPIKAVLLDWAGTTVDYGSRAPTQVFVEIFRRRGVEITVAEARGPMGRAKHEHIAMVAALPRVTELWRQRHGAAPTDVDVRAMYDDFLPLQKEILKQGSDVIPGIPEAIAELRRQGIRIGSSTGYTRALMEIVIPIAAAGGYHADVVVCSDEVSAGRPTPWMNVRAAELLGVCRFDQIVVVDDTPVGIEAAKNGGMMAVAVSLTGNSLGMSEAEVQQMPAAALQQRLLEIETDFRSAGADYVIKSVADLPALLNQP